MTEYIEFECTPLNEECVQVSSTVDYMPAMRQEAVRFRDMLEQRFPDLNGYFSIKRSSHEFGSYLEIRFNFEDTEEGWNESNFVENNLPLTWNDTSILRLSDNKALIERVEFELYQEYRPEDVMIEHIACENGIVAVVYTLYGKNTFCFATEFTNDNGEWMEIGGYSCDNVIGYMGEHFRSKTLWGDFYEKVFYPPY